MSEIVLFYGMQAPTESDSLASGCLAKSERQTEKANAKWEKRLWRLSPTFYTCWHVYSGILMPVRISRLLLQDSYATDVNHGVDTGDYPTIQQTWWSPTDVTTHEYPKLTRVG